MKRIHPFTILVTACVLAPACSDSDPTSPELLGGILATFEVSEEQFSVFVTNADAISQILALDAGTSDANIPNGKLLHGSGTAGHNEPWSWHLDPEDIEMAETTIEICDGRPSLVEDDVDEWVDTVGRFCPWGAEFVSIEDFR
jgi:hypothetical protein